MQAKPILYGRLFKHMATEQILARAAQLLKSKDYENARQHYTKVIDQDCNSLDAYKGRGYCLAQLNEIEKAIDDFQIVINKASSASEKARYYERCGLLLIKLGKYTEAIENLRKAEGLNKSASIYDNLGIAYCKNKDSQNALLCYQYAIELSPNESSYYYKCAVIYNDLKQLDKAINYCLKAQEKDPQNPEKYQKYIKKISTVTYINKISSDSSMMLDNTPGNIGEDKAQYNFAMRN